MSDSAAACPSASRYSTTGSLQIRRAIGWVVISSAQAATYQAFRMNMISGAPCHVPALFRCRFCPHDRAMAGVCVKFSVAGAQGDRVNDQVSSARKKFSTKHTEDYEGAR